MKGFALVASLFLVASANTAFAHEDEGKKGGEVKKAYEIKAVPSELKKFYPPVSQKFEYVEIMHGLSGGLSGTMIDAGQNDWENAGKNATSFVENYKKAAEMSGPEWAKDYFNQKAADKFAAAAVSKDMKALGAAVKEVGKTCGHCHEEQLPNVWLAFYWGDVGELKIEDPISEKKIAFEDYKHDLVNAMNGFLAALREGKTDNAKKAGKEFTTRYKGLQAACMKCHEDEQVKYFYVGGNVEKALAALDEKLAAPALDVPGIYENFGIVSKQGCKNCHLTHRMAAILKDGQGDEEGEGEGEEGEGEEGEGEEGEEGGEKAEAEKAPDKK